VTELHINWTKFADAGEAELARLHGLRSLHQMGPKVKDELLNHVAKLKHLRTLGLWVTCITDKGLEMVSGLSELEEVQLVGSRAFTNNGVRQLTKLPHLRTVGLEGTEIDDSALECLSSLPNARKLNLAFTDITDKGLAKLGKAKLLESVDLRGTSITANAEAELHKALPKLIIMR